MFERFTHEARQVVILAQEEARELRHSYIGTEHILLGLLREGEDLGARALTSLGVELERVRADIRRIVGAGDDVTHGQIPFTPRAKKVLELALREALSLGHDYIGTEHVLLGLIREADGVAIRVLLDLGVDAEQMRNRVIEMVRSAPARPRAIVREGVPRPRPRSSWLDGLEPLLDRLAAEIRREHGREPDPGDLLVVLACLPDALPGRAAGTLGVDLAALWGTVERLRAQAAAATADLREQIERTCRAKEQAIEEQRFDEAASLRDEERRLRERLAGMRAVPHAAALEAARRVLGLPREPPQPQAEAS